jgi:serine/threonine protein phosphatase PrpC
MGWYHELRENSKGRTRSKSARGELRASGLSDPGCERESNEDRFLIFVREDMAGYFVFDGMGGQPAGEAAAQISADVIHGALRIFKEGDLTGCMSHVIELAQQEVLSRAQDPASAGMGTTVVGVLTRDDEIVVGAVGDSRAYHIRRGTVTQVTCDHTLVQQLVDAGQISAHDALVHPQSHILTRCLGSRLDFAVDTRRYQLVSSSTGRTSQEWIVLCSDGLYSLVSDEELGAIVLNYPEDQATSKLIEIARSRGGFDNITAIVIPLPGQLIDPVTATRDTLKRESMPLPPKDLSRVSDLMAASLNIGPRRHMYKRIGAVALLSALALIITVVWLVLFIER